MSRTLVASRMEIVTLEGVVVGWVEVYDDYSIEWEHNGDDYPAVRKTLYKMEQSGPATSLGGAESFEGESAEELSVESPENFFMRTAHELQQSTIFEVELNL